MYISPHGTELNKQVVYATELPPRVENFPRTVSQHPTEPTDIPSAETFPYVKPLESVA